MEQRCVSFAFTTVLLPSFLLPSRRRSLCRLASRPRRIRNNGRMHALLSRFFFPPHPSTRTTREERVKGDAVSLLFSPLFIPTRFSSATFILFNVEDGGRKRVRREREGEIYEGETEKKGCGGCKFNDNTTKDAYIYTYI